MLRSEQLAFRNASTDYQSQPVNIASISRRRDRAFRDDDSPGKLFTYVSAGNIEKPEDNPEPAATRPRSSRPVVLLAVLLVLIWFVY